MTAAWTFNAFVAVIALVLFALIWHASKPRNR